VVSQNVCFTVSVPMCVNAASCVPTHSRADDLHGSHDSGRSKVSELEPLSYLPRLFVFEDGYYAANRCLALQCAFDTRER
jgi:hypothetical protein